jgi:hypothetical protein
VLGVVVVVVVVVGSETSWVERSRMPWILECGLFLFPVSDGSELEGDGSL